MLNPPSNETNETPQIRFGQEIGNIGSESNFNHIQRTPPETMSSFAEQSVPPDFVNWLQNESGLLPSNATNPLAESTHIQRTSPETMSSVVEQSCRQTVSQETMNPVARQQSLKERQRAKRAQVQAVCAEKNAIIKGNHAHRTSQATVSSTSISINSQSLGLGKKDFTLAKGLQKYAIAMKSQTTSQIQAEVSQSCTPAIQTKEDNSKLSDAGRASQSSVRPHTMDLNPDHSVVSIVSPSKSHFGSSLKVGIHEVETNGGLCQITEYAEQSYATANSEMYYCISSDRSNVEYEHLNLSSQQVVNTSDVVKTYRLAIIGEAPSENLQPRTLCAMPTADQLSFHHSAAPANAGFLPICAVTLFFGFCIRQVFSAFFRNKSNNKKDPPSPK